MNKNSRPEVHDLLKLKLWERDACGRAQDLFDRPLPQWAWDMLAVCPWVVVRRGRLADGGRKGGESQGDKTLWVPVGIRGRDRQHRFACVLDMRAVEEIVSPGQLLRSFLDGTPSGEMPPDRTTEQASDDGEKASFWRSVYDPLKALDDRLYAEGLYDTYIESMGIGGSIGFELATGMKAAGRESDIDLLINLKNERGREENGSAGLTEVCRFIYGILKTSKRRIDAVLVGEKGWAALEEYVRSPEEFLLKTMDGCRLAREI